MAEEKGKGEEAAIPDVTEDLEEVDAGDFEDFDLSSAQMYRLRIIDFDGSSELSKIISIVRDDLDIQVFPNPSSDFINLGIDASNSDVEISIFDMSGKQLISNNNMQMTNNRLDITGLQVGLYRIIVKSDKGVYQTSFMKR